MYKRQGFSSLVVRGPRAWFVGGSATAPATLVELDHETGAHRIVRRSASLDLDPGYVSTAQTIEFPTSRGRTAYGFYYPPRNRDFEGPPGERPPLRVRSHGGPTSATDGSLKLPIQYWTSRGFAVLDVNYGGSTGYGRAYRERLNGEWGVVDVEDCVAGARYLAEKGLADPQRLTISGGSAGGYTTLCALAVAVRPNNVLIVAPLALVALRRHPRERVALALPALAGAAALLAYNELVFGTVSGGYGVAAPMSFDFASAIPGLLLSPGRGLFVYFPVTILLVLLLALEPRACANDLAAALLAGVVATVLLTAAWPNWWGGYSYGPRLLAETQPLILLLVALGIGALASPSRRRAFTVALWALLPLQIAIQAVGTYGPPEKVPAAVAWNASPVSIDVAPQRNWDFADNPIARGLRGYD